MRSFFAFFLLAHSLAVDYLSQVFELEGNTADTGAAGFPEDWVPTVFRPGTTTQATSKFHVDDRGSTTVFGDGSTKDNADFNTWTYDLTGTASIPPKNNFNNVYGAAYNFPTAEGNQLIAVFGGDLLERGQGTVTVGLWFLQRRITLDGSGHFVGLHQDNDVLLVVDFSGSDSASTIDIKAYKWSSGSLVPFTSGLTGTSSFRCGNGQPGTAILCATYNTAAITGSGTATSGTGLPFPNSAGTFSAPLATFFEGAVNFNALFGGAGNVPCFTTAIFETRTSNSVTSQLKDFALADFPICNVVASANCPAIEESRNGLLSYVARVTVHVENDGISAQTVTAINLIPGTFPAGATVTSTLPGGGQSIPAGGSADFVVTISNIPRAGFSPQFSVVWTQNGPATLTVSAVCPNPPPLSYSVIRSCANPATAPFFQFPSGFVYQITGSVTATGGSLICTYTDSAGTPSTFTTVLRPLVPPVVTGDSTKPFSYQILLGSADAPVVPPAATISCTDLRGAAVTGTTSVSSSNCPAYTHDFTVSKACGQPATFDAATGLMTYTITVTVANTGTGTLFNCQVTSDPSLTTVNPPVPISPNGGSTQLAPSSSATFTYTITQGFAQQTTAGRLVDLGATVTCKTAGNVAVIKTSGSSNPANCVITFTPSITVSKTCVAELKQATIVQSPVNVPGLYAQVTFDVTVVNNGNLALGNCQISDVRTDGSPTKVYAAPISFTDNSQTIAVGTSKTFHSTYIPQAFGTGLTFGDTATVRCEATVNNQLTATASSATTCRLCP
jgi:hypothetical protein